MKLYVQKYLESLSKENHEKLKENLGKNEKPLK